MHALVTGGAGFIGSHLVLSLLKNGDDVTVIDRFTHGTSWCQSLPSYNTHLFLHTVDLQKKDFCDDISFDDVDVIFHFGARCDKIASSSYPLEYHQVNVGSTVSLLQKANEANIKKFIYISTASCYGTSARGCVSEDHPVHVEDVYALTKYLAEEYVLHWGNVYHLPVIVLRLFNVYGVDIRKKTGGGPIVSRIVSDTKHGGSCHISGDGEWKRDFTYVSDVVSACMTSAHSSIRNEVFNIATGTPHSMNDVIALLGVKKIYHPDVIVSPRVLYADISKAKRLLGWKPQVDLAQGIRYVRESVYPQTS